MLADVIDHIEFTSHIRTDGLTMSIYSSAMVAATPIMNAVFMVLLAVVGYVAPDAAGTLTAQTVDVEVAIGVSYIWMETAAYAICALLMLVWTVEKNLPEEQALSLLVRSDGKNISGEGTSEDGGDQLEAGQECGIQLRYGDEIDVEIYSLDNKILLQKQSYLDILYVGNQKILFSNSKEMILC